MTLENATVLYAHRLKLGKNVDDILRLYPQLKSAHGSSTPTGTSPTADATSVVDSPPKTKESKKNGKKSKR
jgi:alkyl hydroperoxide reductase subunit AhpC